MKIFNRKRQWFIFFIFGVCCFQMQSVFLPLAEATEMVKDSWFNEPQVKGVTPWKWNIVSHYQVRGNQLDKAIKLLADKKLIELSDKKVFELIGKQLVPDEGFNFYLVRAVIFNEGTGKFYVYHQDNKLWIYHGSLGKSFIHMKRKVLVIPLSQKPKEVFVTCSMDE